MKGKLERELSKLKSHRKNKQKAKRNTLEECVVRLASTEIIWDL